MGVGIYYFYHGFGLKAFEGRHIRNIYNFFSHLQGAIVGTITSYFITMWIGIGKYTVVGVKDYLPTPTSNCGTSINNVTIATTILSSVMTYNMSGLVMDHYNIVTDNSIHPSR